MSGDDWRQDLMLGIEVAIIFGLLVIPIALHPHQGERQGGNYSAYTQLDYAADRVFGPQSPQRDPEPNRDEWREEEDLNAQQAMALWAAAMFFITAAGVFYVARTLDETRKATKAAQDAVAVTREMGEKQTQAYLVIKSGHLRLTEVRAPKKPMRNALYCRLVIANKGQSPARSVSVEYKVRLFRRGTGANFPLYFKFSETQGCPDVGPDDAERIIIAKTLDDDAQALLETSNSFVDVEGVATWTNEFGRPGQRQVFGVQTNMFWKTQFYAEGWLDPEVSIPFESVGRRDV